MVREDQRLHDYVYAARHPLIAEVVFERILPRRPNVMMSMFDWWQVSKCYSTPQTLRHFRQLIRGRPILEFFPDHTAAAEIYRLALENAGEDPYVLQQRGIYEMLRPNGNLTEAHTFLTRAQRLAPRNATITHSLAELELKQAESARSTLDVQRHREEARRLAAIVRDDPVHGSFGYHTILKVLTDHLREMLHDNETANDDIDRVLQEIEATIAAGFQRFPDDSYLLSSEAEISELLQDADRARTALEYAFERNRRSPYIAGRLARIYQSEGRVEDAVQVLKTAVDTNPGDRRLRFSLAMALEQSTRGNAIDDITYHLARSYTPGDRTTTLSFGMLPFYISKVLPML